jgi:exodeoxyribonuclease V gamma subunit
MMQDGYAHANPEADAIKSASSNIKAKLPERVSIYKLSDFLKDPFQFRISQMLADSDSEDPEKEMFEPIQLDALKKSTLLKMTLAAELSNKSDELDKFKKESKLKGGTPDGVFGDKLTAEIEANKKIITDNMGEDLVQKIKDSWSYQAKIEDIQFERSDSEKWTLSGSLDWSDSSDLDKITEMISITSSGKKPTIDKFLTSYIRALAVIAQRNNDEKAEQEQSIKISVFHVEKDRTEPTTATIKMTPKKATETLQKIYTAAFGSETQKPYFKAVPAELINATGINDIRAFKEKLINGPWEHFEKKTLFDPTTDVGFDKKDFAKQWEEAKDKMTSLTQMTITVPKARRGR